jgi:hypothetical protein
MNSWRSDEHGREWIKTGVSALSVAIAVVALSTSTCHEIRNRKAAERQLVRQELLARAEVRPSFVLEWISYTNNRGLKLVNYGIGPGFLVQAEFCMHLLSGPQCTRSFHKLITLPHRAKWKTTHSLVSTVAREGHAIELGTLTFDNLRAQGLSAPAAKEVLAAFDQQRACVRWHIEYADLYGNLQAPIDREARKSCAAEKRDD